MNNLRSSRREAASRAPRMSIVYRAIGQLKPDPANPRRHSKKQIRQIANSIEAFGFNVPVLVDAELNVICGHGRLLACRELGWTEVPTLCLDHLSPAQLRAFMIADNRLTEIASWDDQLLAQQLKDLSLLGLDFSIEVTGFEMGEIDLRIASLEAMPDTDDPADAVPELPTRPPLSKAGDLWLLGRHCVSCGNALDSAAYAALLGKERAAMVFTDPPYNVEINGHASGRGAIRHRPFPMASGEMIGIGGHLAMPPLPHHRAYGSVPRRFDRVKLGRRRGVGEDRVSRNSGCARLVGPPGVRTCARAPSVNRRRPLH